LGRYLNTKKNFKVWCSPLQRSLQTVHLFTPRVWPELHEIRAGIWEGRTYSEFQSVDPVGYGLRSEDKYNYRYENGESYADVWQRLQPVFDTLRSVSRDDRAVIVIVGHQAIIRMLLAWFHGGEPECYTGRLVRLHELLGFDYNIETKSWQSIESKCL
jgi:broad specificity phosphatase PhoE